MFVALKKDGEGEKQKNMLLPMLKNSFLSL